VKFSSKFLKRQIPILFVLFILNGCSTTSTLQTADTLKPGETKILAALEASPSRLVSSSHDEFSGTYVNPTVSPLPLIFIRRGLAENFDLGVKFALLGTIQAEIKYQFISVSQFGLAAGLGLGISPYWEQIRSAKQHGYEADIPHLGTRVPIALYAHFLSSSDLVFYASPKYTWTLVKDINNSTWLSDRGITHDLGLSVGVKISKSPSYLVELGLNRFVAYGTADRLEPMGAVGVEF
jgi:hypothetical protein